MAFRVGQKVVLKDDRFKADYTDPRYRHIILPVRGQIYTIRDIGPWEVEGHDSKIVCVRLFEIRNKVCCWTGTTTVSEFQFAAWRFRPLQDRPKEADTNISVFKPLLKATKVDGEDAPAKTPETAPQ